MKAVLIDAHDSFVHILSQYLLEIGVDTTVIRNNEVNSETLRSYDPDFILLGPGPGHPLDARYVEILVAFGDTTPILGVCLGHQAIGAAYGAKVVAAENLMHGKSCLVHHDAVGCFRGVENPLKVTRYHSLVVAYDDLPSCLTVTSRAEGDNYIMGLRHAELPIESFQFHPESIGTNYGHKLLENFMHAHVRSRGDSRCYRTLASLSMEQAAGNLEEGRPRD